MEFLLKSKVPLDILRMYSIEQICEVYRNSFLTTNKSGFAKSSSELTSLVKKFTPVINEILMSDEKPYDKNKGVLFYDIFHDSFDGDIITSVNVFVNNKLETWNGLDRVYYFSQEIATNCDVDELELISDLLYFATYNGYTEYDCLINWNKANYPERKLTNKEIEDILNNDIKRPIA